jgi:hypothetical protein
MYLKQLLEDTMSSSTISPASLKLKIYDKTGILEYASEDLSSKKLNADISLTVSCYGDKVKTVNSLFGLPKSISGYLDLWDTNISDLEHCTDQVDLIQIVKCNNLTSLKGFPSKVGGSIVISECEKLSTLTDLPNEFKFSFILTYCKNIKSFDGMPKIIHDNVILARNGFTSLHNIHKHFERIDGVLDITSDIIEDSLLGILLIAGVHEFDVTGTKRKEYKSAAAIINKYLKLGGGRSNVIDCQRELIEAGLEDYAKL